MVLQDTIENIGCIARDSLVVTAEGIFFLARQGLHFMDRYLTIATLSSVERKSEFYNDTLQSAVADVTPDSKGRLRSPRGHYHRGKNWYLLSMPDSNKTFCVHMSVKVGEKARPAVTTWTNTGMPFYGFATDFNGDLWTAGEGGVYKYSGYTSDGGNLAYTFTYYTQWLPIEDEAVIKILKHLTLALTTVSGQAGTVYWLKDYIDGSSDSVAFTTDAAEFAENPGTGVVKVPLTGACNVVKIGVSFAVSGAKIRLDQIRLFMTKGARIK